MQGYVEHRLNTDNAWVETQTINYHDDFNLVFKDIRFNQLTKFPVPAHWVKIDKTLKVPATQLELLSKA